MTQNICLPRRNVVKIESFTARAEAMRLKVSRVTHDYELKDGSLGGTAADIAVPCPQI